MPTTKPWLPDLPAWAAQRHTDQHAYASSYNPPQPILIAEHAQRATWRGTCGICRWPVLPGDHVARLVATGDWAHVSCTGEPAAVFREPKAEQANRQARQD